MTTWVMVAVRDEPLAAKSCVEPLEGRPNRREAAKGVRGVSPPQAETKLESLLRINGVLAVLESGNTREGVIAFAGL